MKAGIKRAFFGSADRDLIRSVQRRLNLLGGVFRFSNGQEVRSFPGCSILVRDAGDQRELTVRDEKARKVAVLVFDSNGEPLKKNHVIWI